MRKTMFIMLMAFMMTIPSVPFLGGMDKVYASETHHSQSDAVNWIKARGNECWWEDVDGGFGCQCVDLIQKYYQWFGYARLSGNAYEYKSGHIPRGSGWYYSNTPIPGAVFVKDADGTYTYGHVGLVYAVDNSKIYTVETNIRSPYDGGNNAGARYSEHPRSGYAATFICPDFAPSIPQGSPIGGGARIISDGDYHIISELDHSKGIDVTGASSANGANIQLYANTADNKQVFTVKYLGDGFYSIRNKASGKSIDVADASRNYGTNVQLYDWNGTAAQKWVIENLWGEVFKIKSNCNGLCLDVKDYQTDNGTNIQVWGDNGATAQMWRFVKVPVVNQSRTIPDGDYQIVSFLDNTKGVDVFNADTKNGTNIQLYGNLGDTKQVFSVKYENGSYTIRNKMSGKSLDVENASCRVGANVHLFDCNGTNAQRWIIRPSTASGYYSIISKCNGLCLDIKDYKTVNGTNIQVWDTQDNTAQRWKFVRVLSVTVPKGKALTYNGKTQAGVAAGSNYTLSGTTKAINAGTYTAKVNLKTTSGNICKWSDGTTAAKSIKWTINKAANPLTIKPKTATVKYSAVKKKAQIIGVTKVITFTKKGQGKLTYAKVSGNKKIAINKTTGEVTVKKGLKKGTYKVKIKIKAAGNANYKASAWKTVTFRVRIK